MERTGKTTDQMLLEREADVFGRSEKMSLSDFVTTMFQNGTDIQNNQLDAKDKALNSTNPVERSAYTSIYNLRAKTMEKQILAFMVDAGAELVKLPNKLTKG